MSLSYTANGETKYAGVSECEAAKGEWVKLSNESFEIPEDASGMLLYIETDSGTANFYIDDAFIAADGTVGE